ncbi:MAG TPA: response regulator [Polyangiaceae bacterium]|nr:response regulator [Polyangiaceae bacterium]
MIPSRARASGGHLATLLAVEDSKTMRKVLEITFAGEDHRLVLAQNSDDALSQLQSQHPNVVIVDANLQGGRGYDLCAQVKERSPATPVLMLSSKQQPYDRSRGGSVGADDFIDKPFDTQQLIDKVAALAKRAAQAPQPAISAPAAVSPAPGAAPVHERTRTQTLGFGTPAASRPQTLLGTAPPPAGPSAAPAAPSAPPAAVPTATPAPASVPAPTAAPVAAALGANGQMAERLGAIGLSAEQVQAVLALSREVVEKVVWEVVPVLAETMIKEEIKRLTAE